MTQNYRESIFGKFVDRSDRFFWFQHVFNPTSGFKVRTYNQI